jgi:hypothetical protein
MTTPSHPAIHPTRSESHPLGMGYRGPGSGTVETWPSDSDLLGAVVSSFYYEIRVAGVLPPEALLDFDRLTASVEPVETVVHGPIRDQAALQSLLARLEACGIQVLEIRRLRTADAPPEEDSKNQ